MEVLHSTGSKLSPVIRELMEFRFGRDFGRVRVHTGQLATASAWALRAEAYTAGEHIVFADEYYRPETPQGQWLLAHELAHVVQQCGAYTMSPLDVGACSDPLERAADRAADLVTAGNRLPRGFRFGRASPGRIQRHPGQPCGGLPLQVVDPASIELGIQVLERAYRNDPINADHADAIFFGSNWENNFRIPPGAPNQKFARDLLNRLRGYPVLLRPNIIDFEDRVAYQFQRADDPVVNNALNTFHRVAGAAQRSAGMNEPEWNSFDANWFPDHTLLIPADPANRFVCTEMTQHQPARGLILYAIRQSERRRRTERRPTEFEIVAFEPNFIEFGPMAKAFLPKAIPYFDPANSNFVIIVPQEFFTLDYVKNKVSSTWLGPMRMKVPFFNQIITTATVMFVIMGAAQIGAGLLAAAPVIAGAMAGTTVTASASTAAGTTIEVVVAYEAGTAAASATAAGATTTAAATELAMLVAHQTLMSTAAKVGLTASAGAILLLSNIRTAKAGTATTPPEFVVDHSVGVRVVACADFQNFGGVQSATGVPNPNVFQPASEAKGKFGLGTRVLFDNKPHWIMGQVSVR